MREGYKNLLKSIYAPRPYYQRIRAFLLEYKTPSIRMPIDLPHIKAFLRSVYHLGILGRERLQYWKLLGWTILHRPALLATAVRLAICGRHYRLMSDR